MGSQISSGFWRYRHSVQVLSFELPLLHAALAFLRKDPRKTRRKQLAENNWWKILSEKRVEKQLTERSRAENSLQEQKIISDKILC